MDTETRVLTRPPYKQTPAGASERKNQKAYRDALVAEARRSFPQPREGRIRIDVSYSRASGRADAMNILGGIADSLQGIAYLNDRQIVNVNYSERKARTDQYTVRLSSSVPSP